MRTRPFAAVPLAAALAACTQGHVAYPSLQPRATEARTWDEPKAAPPAPIAADPALDAKLAEQRAALAAITQRYTTHVTRSEALVRAARGDAAGGERWLAAQQSLTDLDADRADTSTVVATLEQLQLDRVATLGTDYPPLEEAHAAAQAQLSAETQRIGALGAMLPGS